MMTDRVSLEEDSVCEEWLAPDDLFLRWRVFECARWSSPVGLPLRCEHF
jgi:hypothetical protein